MNFNDYQLPSNKEYDIMKQYYDTILSRDTQELQQILDKMKDVRESLEHENRNGKYNSILYKYDNNIDELERLIHGLNTSNPSHVNTYSIPNIPSEFRNIRKLQNNEDAISPIRSNDEINRHRNMRNTSPSQPTMDRPITPNNPNFEERPVAPNIPDTSNLDTRANIHKRNRPMQGSILSTLFKKFAINSLESSDDGYRNKYHVQVANQCISIQKIRTNQIDIVRLLLLYLALNPNCRYCSRIASLANDQFMILNEMSN